METLKAFETFMGIPAGRFFRITYKTEPKKTASGKYEQIVKTVSKTVRTGVRYSHISGVVMSEDNKRTPWYTWVVPNRIARSNKDGTLYFAIMPTVGSNTKVKWSMNGREVSANDVFGYVQQRSGDAPKFQFIKAENIIGVGNGR